MKIKLDFYTKALIVVLLAGVALLLYPTVSNYWNSFHQTRAIGDYVQHVDSMDNDEYAKEWENARRFNEMIYRKRGFCSLTPQEREVYYNLLNMSGDGVMGYVNIPAIKLSLVVYHGIDETVLQVGAGHIEGTSLPVGGENTHAAISGHRGLVSAKLFSNLNTLVKGDVFTLNVLDATLTYEVDQVLIVKPDETEAINVEAGKDYCTLITCTPYGINSHRLLVRGHRIDNIDDLSLRIGADAMQIDPILVAPILAIPLLLILLIGLFVKYR